MYLLCLPINGYIISNQIKSNLFVTQNTVRLPMKEVKQKVMCQQDTKAAKSCTNRCPNKK